MLVFSLTITVLIVGLFLLSLRKVGAVNAATFFVATYVVFVIPKYFAMTVEYERASHFYRNFVLADRYLIDLSFVIVSLFVLALLLAFVQFLPTVRVTARRTRDSVWVNTRLAYVIIFPVGLLITYLLFQRMGIDLFAGFSQKRSFVNESGGTDLVNYFLIKAAYIVKIPFYIYLYQYPTLKNRGGWHRATAILSFAFGALLHVVFSQRSGVLLMVLDLLFVVSAMKPVKVRHLVWALGVLFAVNVGVLVSRGVGYNMVYLVVVMFFRRYFMDVEKISNILMYIKAERLGSAGSGALQDMFIWDTSHFRLPEDIHFFIGGEVFGLSSVGIPPSLVGEVILRMGTAPLLVIAVALGYALKRLDMMRFRSNRNLVVVGSAMIIARASYFFSNSDVLGLVLRLVLDLALLGVGIVLYRVFKQVHKLPEVPAASTG